jgi:hypothetical protein
MILRSLTDDEVALTLTPLPSEWARGCFDPQSATCGSFLTLACLREGEGPVSAEAPNFEGEHEGHEEEIKLKEKLFPPFVLFVESICSKEIGKLVTLSREG